MARVYEIPKSLDLDDVAAQTSNTPKDHRTSLAVLGQVGLLPQQKLKHR